MLDALTRATAHRMLCNMPAGPDTNALSLTLCCSMPRPPVMQPYTPGVLGLTDDVASAEPEASPDVRLPLQSSLRFAVSQAAGCATFNMLRRKEHANM